MIIAVLMQHVKGKGARNQREVWVGARRQDRAEFNALDDEAQGHAACTALLRAGAPPDSVHRT